MIWQKKKVFIGAFGVIIIPVIVFIIYLSFDNAAYSINIKRMNENKELNVQIESEQEHKTLKLSGYDIHYFVSGKANKDLIIFLHPAFSDHRAFDQQIDCFSKDYRVITIDLIGHGLSKANKSKDYIDASSEHLRQILESEGISKAHLVGVSVGTLIAQYFALQYPEKVKSITALGGYDIDKENKEVVKAQRASNLGLIIRAIFSLKSFRKNAAEMTCCTKRGQALFYETTSLFERKSFMVMQGLSNIIKNRPHVIHNYPTLILAGEFDVELSKKLAKEWNADLNNSAFSVIKAAGHCANIDQPEQFNDLLKGFIDKHKE